MGRHGGVGSYGIDSRLSATGTIRLVIGENTTHQTTKTELLRLITLNYCVKNHHAAVFSPYHLFFWPCCINTVLLNEVIILSWT